VQEISGIEAAGKDGPLAPEKGAPKFSRQSINRQGGGFGAKQ
jgi:hypothetical protein